MNDKSLKSLRMTAAEVLAYAVFDLFPGVSLLGSEVTAVGFSYRFHTRQPVTVEVLPLIEERMRAIVKQASPIGVMEMMRVNALEFFRHHKLNVLVDRLGEVRDDLVKVLKIESFYDLLEGSCGETTGDAGAFKLLSLESLPDNITLISGTAFPEKQSLKKFLKKLDQYKGFAFTAVAQELQLALGDIWLPKGVALRDLLDRFLKNKLKNRGFKEIYSINTDAFSLLFKASNSLQSHLPLRYSQFPTAKTFCTENQLQQEIISSLQFFDKIVNIFGFRYHYVLCPTRARISGSLKNWGKSVDLLAQTLDLSGFQYEIDQQKECTFGPRVEVCITDILERCWTGPTLTIDLLSPQKFSLTYKSVEDVDKVVESVSLTLFESLEQMIKLLVEHHKGVLPLWLAPEQVRVVPLSEANKAYAVKIEQQLKSAGIRVQIDSRANALGERIHMAISEKVPYTIIVGEKEEKSGTISVRKISQKESQSGLRAEELLEHLRQEIVET